MNILFVGLLYNPIKEKELIRNSNVGLSIASNIFQWNIINGLSEQEQEINISVLGSVPLGNFPKLSNKLICNNKQWNSKFQYKEIGFVNFYIIKHYIRKKSIEQEINKWLIKYSNQENVIIFYDLYKPFLDLIKKFERKKDVKTCLIVPDLAGKYRNNTERGKLVDFISNISTKRIFTNASKAYYHIFLTEYMKEIINSNQYLVIDGIIDQEISLNENNDMLQDEKVIMYAGALSKEYNLDILIKAFMELKNKEFRLYICGAGGMEKEIQEAAMRDARIKYYGFVDKNTIIELEKKVDIYINPRSNSGIFTRYSFPSKNLEYLLACKPVICHKLSGMSDEYDDIFIYLKNNTVEEVRNTMYEYLSLPRKELREIGKKGQAYVLKNKNKKVQAKRIIDFFKGE